MKTRQLPTELPPSYYKITVEENEEKIRNFVKVFNEQLAKYKYDFDDDFRIVFDSNLEKFKFGNKVIPYDKDNNTFSLEDIKDKIPASDGLWELILSENPKNYTKGDLNNYQKMIFHSDIIFEDNDKATGNLKTYEESEKWKEIIEPVFNYITDKMLTGKGLRKKKTATVIPSDPNALIERLDLLMASKDAGNTGVRNELISICDELKRQRVLNARSYKKLIAIL